MDGHIVERESSAPGAHEKKTEKSRENAIVGQCPSHLYSSFKQ